MAWYPDALAMNIKPTSIDPPIKVVGAILHVDAGNNESLYEYFKHRSGGIESHFHIPKHKPIEQYRNTGREADANWKANSFWRGDTRCGFVSIETQGLEYGTWNKKQLNDIKNLLVWLSDVHDFDLKESAGPYRNGVGYHTMWGSPSAWTPVAKSCPGPNRIRQFNRIIVPWMNRGGNVSDRLDSEWHDDELIMRKDTDDPNDSDSPAWYMQRIYDFSKESVQILREIRNELRK